jgi:prepilin-type N-terminal cleavage/methylation domain-containing protein
MRRRPGVTLIELLVVIGIITALATMIVAIAPRFGERQRASRGAGQLQSWLNLAKQRALRDRRPVGIRMPYLANSSYVTELQYVELPDEGVGGTVTVPYPPSSPNTAPDYHIIKFVTTVSFAPNDPQLQNSPSALIQTGDAITFPDRPLGVYAMRRIAPTNLPPAPDDSVAFISKDMTANPPLYTYRVRLDQALPQANFTTQSHIFSRKARPVVGEPVLQLPKDIAIDITSTAAGAYPQWYRMFPAAANPHGNQPFDILFSPAGQVIGAEGNLGSRICLWVRDVSLGDPGPSQLPPGYNTLITIYTRTGHVTAHEINSAGLNPNLSKATNTWNPFLFTQDGLTSGY